MSKHHRSSWAVVVCVLGGAVVGALSPAGVATAAAPPGGGAAEGRQPAASRRVPLIYGSDLLHPHDDPDDHFDLATLFALPELDVKAILLDQGDRQTQRSGRVPVEQMLKLTGRKIPYAVGLRKKLTSPQDDGRDQPAEYQEAVELLLETLRASPEPMIVLTAGSVRDVCAAFNRDPELLRAKVSRVYINMGSLLEDQGEWNELLDPQSYIGLMRSGLPVHWCPCRPTKENRTSHYAFKHGEVLEGVPPGLLNFFVYALQVVRPNEIDPLAAMDMDLRPWRHILMGMERNMWCTGSFLHASGRSIFRVGDRWVPAFEPPEGGTPVEVFSFVPAHVTIEDRKGRAFTKWSEQTGTPNMFLYKVLDPEHHEAAMKGCLRELLARFPVAAGASPGAPGARTP